ncbi:uncharacterized protein At4g33100-like [Selaginella moellendorffii]|uniref:uncharacterized protein At4g33100-like n=1 Tax=Selaginella moellendorffii TaxID=88036 RepID=UPI000D1CE403|nr:uncharacterized protein At4g33100-like [Selaginella moellendorffii]|eukprot:XP_024518882.1 uncharacterized protein At4g33100-like [Selaginella moellendorffii]
MARPLESSAPSRRSSGDPCKAARSAYDRCFNRWYLETYVKKMEPWKKEDCGAEWEEYQACFTKRLEGTKIEQLVKKERDALMRQSDA